MADIVPYDSQILAYTPRDPQEAFELAKRFAASKLLGEVGTPEQAFLIMATGAELGIPATTALRSIRVQAGKPTLSADLLRSLVLRSPACEYFRCAESTDISCRWVTKRKNHPEESLTWTMADAERAGLSGKDNYRKYPRQLLNARCSAELARRVYPDVVLGVYLPDEIEPDTKPIEAKVVEVLRAADEPRPITIELVEEPEPQPEPELQGPPVPTVEQRFLQDISAANSVADLDEVKAAMKTQWPDGVPKELVTAFKEKRKGL